MLHLQGAYIGSASKRSTSTDMVNKKIYMRISSPAYKINKQWREAIANEANIVWRSA